MVGRRRGMAQGVEECARGPAAITVDRDALERGRRYSARQGTSISRLVTDFLRTLPEDDATAALAPAVRRLLGSARGEGDRGDYMRHLEEKYGA
jgi:hypothetical protein